MSHLHSAIVTTMHTVDPWQDAAAEAIFTAHIAVLVVRHPWRPQWHVCVSLYGNDLSTIGIYLDRALAVATTLALTVLLQQWHRLPDPSYALKSFLDDASANSSIPPTHDPLPESSVRAALAALRNGVMHGQGTQRPAGDQ